MDQLAQYMMQLSEKFGPHAVEAARDAATVAALSSLQSALWGVAWGIGIFMLGRWAWRKDARDDLGMPFGRIGAGILFLIAGITLAVSLGSMTDPWLWATFKNPDLWIAKNVLHL